MSKAEFKNFLNEQAPPEDAWRPKVKPMVAIHYSDKFRTILNNIMKTGDQKSKAVTKELIDLEKTNKTFVFSYLELVKTSNDTISFLQAPRAWRMMNWESEEESFPTPAADSELWTSAQRQTIGVGKIVGKLFEDDKFSQDAINSFINTFKAECDAIGMYDRFQVVDGENLRRWYHEKSYAQGSGILNGSCMRYEAAQKFLDMYVKNPEKCALVILTDGAGKLIGRALLWKNLRKPNGKTFMDRIYTIKQSDEEMFKKFAKENGWIYKYQQSSHDASYMDGDKRVYDSLSLQLTPVPQSYSKYPYMDTMKYFTPESGRLASDAGQAIRKCSKDGAWIRPLTEEQKSKGMKETCEKCGATTNFTQVQRHRLESADGSYGNV